MPSKGSVTPDRSGYLDIRSRSAVTFDLDARFPAQVFRESAGDSLFCEFDVVLAPEMWAALCTMARWHGDEHIDLLVLEPDCDDLYLPQGLGYPARSLSVEAGEDDYWAAIGFEPDGDALGSITISADVVALTGASGRWGCWGERGPEVAVFQGFAAARSEWCARFGPFLDVSGALESYLSMAFGRRPVPDDYAAALSANYGPPSGGRSCGGIRYCGRRACHLASSGCRGGRVSRDRNCAAVRDSLTECIAHCRGRTGGHAIGRPRALWVRKPGCCSGRGRREAWLRPRVTEDGSPG
jgi:hypothetical protein